MNQHTRVYIASIAPSTRDYEPAQHMQVLVTMGATPLAALWVMERKTSRKFRRTIERLER